MKIGSVFISHSSKDPDYQVTKALAEGLKESGIHVWWDEERLEGGKHFPAEILEALIEQHFFLYITSSHSVVSTWCQRELIRATQLGKDRIPLLLEEIPIEKQPIELAGVQYIDVRKGIPEAMPKILRALGLGLRSEYKTADDPFTRDGRLVNIIAGQVIYGKTFTDSLNLIQMLKNIGLSLCETDRARQLFEGMISPSNYGYMRIDYEKVKTYLLNGWNS